MQLNLCNVGLINFAWKAINITANPICFYHGNILLHSKMYMGFVILRLGFLYFNDFEKHDERYVNPFLKKK